MNDTGKLILHSNVMKYICTIIGSGQQPFLVVLGPRGLWPRRRPGVASAILWEISVIAPIARELLEQLI